MARSRPYKDGLFKRLQDPQEAAAYLDAVLETGDQDVCLLALRDVAAAREHLWSLLSNREKFVAL